MEIVIVIVIVIVSSSNNNNTTLVTVTKSYSVYIKYYSKQGGENCRKQIAENKNTQNNALCLFSFFLTRKKRKKTGCGNPNISMHCCKQKYFM
jgi:hypothetical protein